MGQACRWCSSGAPSGGACLQASCLLLQMYRGLPGTSGNRGLCVSFQAVLWPVCLNTDMLLHPPLFPRGLPWDLCPRAQCTAEPAFLFVGFREGRAVGTEHPALTTREGSAPPGWCPRSSRPVRDHLQTCRDLAKLPLGPGRGPGTRGWSHHSARRTFPKEPYVYKPWESVLSRSVR